MVKSAASTVAAYLRALAQDRREVVSAVRDLLVEHLPKGYRESMNWGMISYEIPLARYPTTYNGQPLLYVAIAAQKHHIALYLHGVYQDAKQERALKEGFKRAGKKLDMGKSCVRFRALDDLPLDVVGTIVSRTTPEQMIAQYEKVRTRASRRRASRPRVLVAT